MQQFTIQLACIRKPRTKCYLQRKLASPFSSKQFPPMTLKSIVYCLSGENLGDIASLFFLFVWLNFQLISLAAMTREGTII